MSQTKATNKMFVREPHQGDECRIKVMSAADTKSGVMRSCNMQGCSKFETGRNLKYVRKTARNMVIQDKKFIYFY